MTNATYDQDAQTEWDKRTQEGVYLPSKIDLDSVLFKNLFDRYLPKGKLKALEIGAIPGRFLIYLHKHHGYDITGLDFSSNSSNFHANMKENGIEKYTFINEDFEKFSTKKQFDVVLSFGFVEHFNNDEEIVRKHCQHIKHGGYLFIEMPNFRKLQYFYHSLFDKKSLRIHNTNAMDLKRLDNVIHREGFSLVFSGYEGKLETWREPDPIGPIKNALNRLLMWFITKFGMHFPVSPLYSPFMVVIYKKNQKT